MSERALALSWPLNPSFCSEREYSEQNCLCAVAVKYLRKLVWLRPANCLKSVYALNNYMTAMTMVNLTSRVSMWMTVLWALWQGLSGGLDYLKNVIIIIIIIAFKGAVQDLLQSPRCAANCLQHVRSSGQGTIVWKSRATHRAPIMYNVLCATWYEGIAQLLSLTEFKSHLF